jgi:hypothetical protein
LASIAKNYKDSMGVATRVKNVNLFDEKFATKSAGSPSRPRRVYICGIGRPEKYFF